MKYIGTLIILAGCYFAGFYTHRYISPRDTAIDIFPVGAGTSTLLRPDILTMPVKSPVRYQELENCFRNSIDINGKLVSNTPFIFRVEASDACKQSTRNFRIKVGSKGNWNMYLLGSIALAGLALGYTLKK